MTEPVTHITVGMVDPWGQVARECANPKIPWKSVALTYAFGIRQATVDPLIAPANAAIIARFGVKGLDKIKGLAWDYVTGRKSP